MAISMNKVLIGGNLTRTPEIRYTQNGNAVCSFTVAVNQGTQEKPETVFIDCTAWKKTAEFVSRYLDKGSPVLVDGELRQDTWEDKATGAKRSKLNVTARNVQSLRGNQNGTEQQGQSYKQPNSQRNEAIDNKPPKKKEEEHRYSEEDLQGHNPLPEEPPQELEDDIPF